jgi:proline iminopeptidase
MRLLRLTLYGVGVVVLFLIAATVFFYMKTAGDYPVAATVVDDPDLPQFMLGDATFHVQTFGDPANESIIVLHGGPGADFRSLLALQALSDQYHVVFYDQRGSGLSQRFRQDTLTVATHVSDLDAMIAEYGQGKPVTLIGHSWGAILAAAYMDHTPENISRAVLIEPGFLTEAGAKEWQTQAKRYQSGNDFISLALRTGFEAQHVDGPDVYAADDYLYSQMVHFFTDHPDNPYHCQGRNYDAPLWRFGAAASKASVVGINDGSLQRVENGARSYAGPVMLMAGECDTWIGQELQSQHLLMFRDAILNVIPDAGHDITWDKPDATLRAIRDFLDH